VTGAANVMLSGNTVGGETGSTQGTPADGGLWPIKEARGSSRLLTTVNSGGKQEFKIMVTNAITYTTLVAATFNFDRTSGRYIRKVFNTNPQLCYCADGDYWFGHKCKLQP